MDKIGFKNFRRFRNFPPIKYTGITFFVGRNNAGKSTVVKALLLVNDYLKSGDISKFTFGSINIEDTNIVTFGRAKNKKVNGENFIEFTLQADYLSLNIIISGEDDKTVVNVHSVLISDQDQNLEYLFKPNESTITISKNRPKVSIGEAGWVENILNDTLFSEKDLKEAQAIINLKNQLLKEENELKRELESLNIKKTSREYIDKVEEINLLKKKQKMLSASFEEDTKPGPLYSITTEYGNKKTFLEIVQYAVDTAIVYHNVEFPKIQEGKEQSSEFINNRAIKEEETLITKSFTGFHIAFIELPSIFYLGSNATKQSALFPIRDKNNALAQAIHDYYQLKISAGEPAYEFVEKWMKIFEVGESFRINIYAGEAYEIKILSNNTEIHLADKGMGSIQAMLLIFRLASIIHKTLGTDNIVTVVIEEPELNLHPALQSKLADLFLEVYEKYGLWFIVETHSEYILRRSQVLVAEKEFQVAPNTNPFCVHYFPKDISQQSYRLEYQEDGSFNRNFGDGFFDEASSSTLELLKLKRQKKA